MFESTPGAPFIAIAVALMPALLRWCWGRPLARLADDAAMAERLAAHLVRVRAVKITCAMLLLVGWPHWMIATLALQLAAQTAAGYSLRKTLYSETWSMGAYLGFYARLTFSVFAFWMVLFAMPSLVSMAAPHEWLAAVALGALMLAWNWFYSDVLRVLLRVMPVAEGPLLERFRAVATRSTAPMPRFEYVDMRGGVVANALALASLRGSSVLFTDTLLARLTADESVAICGHEIAHLEYYDRRRLSRINAMNMVLIVLGAALVPVAKPFTSRLALGYLSWLFPILTVLALAVRARHRQRNETASDLRAIGLTGDAEALASGLTMLHAIARVPRRWARQREQQATHPSLARRLRDIRAAAGLSAVPVESSGAFRAASADSVVVFEPSRLSWQESSGATHLLDYTALSELRLHASHTGAVTLVAVERQGRRWQMTPQPTDISALQSVLDTVDGRLTIEAKPNVFSPSIARVVTFVAAWLILVGAQISVAVVALLATVNAGPALLNAAGAAALVGAALLLRDGSTVAADSPFFAVVTAVAGLAFLGLGWARRTIRSRLDAPLTAAIGVGAVLAVAGTALGGVDPVRLHQGARALPAATVLLVGLAGACWTRREHSIYRHIALTSVAVGGVMTIIGTTTFLDLAGRDPFLAGAPRPTTMMLDAKQTGSFDLPFSVESLQLSPRGTLVAATRSDDDDAQAQDAAPAIYVGRATAPLLRVEASDIAFVDERRALLLVLNETSADVQEVTFDGASPVTGWRERIDGIRSGALRYQPRTNQWVLLGRDGKNRIVRVEGTAGGTGVTTGTWSDVTSRGSWIDAIATHDATALIVERHYEFGLAKKFPLLGMIPGLPRNYSETRLARVAGGRRTETGFSQLETTCSSGTLERPSGERVVCTAFDGTRTHLAAIDPATAAVTPLVTLDGRFWASEIVTDGWTSGWWDYGPAAIRLATHTAVRVPRIADEFVSQVTATDAVIATVTALDTGSRVRLYPLGGPRLSARRDE